LDIYKNNIDQIYEFFPYALEPLEFAIAPRGVMIMHSSMSVNNPAFWFSHSDFRNIIAKERNKPNFNLLEFAQHIVTENGSMYEAFFKNAKNFNALSFNTFLQLFEHYRSEFKDTPYQLHPV
jgi:hypothetical protein